jgi:N-acyl-D-aspartate/D-glutamate deacylase
VGIRHVLVNGALALQDGAPTGARAGRVLRRQDAAAFAVAANA